MQRLNTHVVAAGVCAAAGACVWVSLGTLAVTDLDTSMRIVALPPLWLLALVTVLAGAAAWLAGVPAERTWPLLPAAVLWLPYVPGRVPAAFLLWQGPIEGLVWLVVAAGCVAAARWPVPRMLTTAFSSPRAAPWLAGLLAAACYGASAIALNDRLPDGDEPHYLIIAQSLLRDGDLQIENNHRRGDFAPYAQNELPPHYMTRGANGEIYSSHPIGAAALVAPGFALFGYAGASATVIAATAAAAGLAWHTAWLLTASAGAAWVGWAAIFLTAPFLLQGFTVFPDAIGGLCVMAGVWVLVRSDSGLRTRPGVLCVVGAALAALPWLHSRLALVAAMLGITIGWRLVRERRGAAPVLALFIVPCVSVVAWFAFFWTLWGTVDPRVPYGGAVRSAWSNVEQGIIGVFLDQRFGLVSAAPVYLCAPAGMLALGRRRPRLAAEMAVVAAPYTMMMVGYETWWGGFGGPARYLGALLPAVVLPMAWLWSVRRPPGGAWVLLLAIVSVATLVLRIVVDRGSMAYAERLGPDALLDWAARSVDLPAAFPGFRTPSHWVDVAAWALVLAAAWAGPALLWRRRMPGAARAWAAVACSAELALMAGSTAVWSLHQHPAVSPSKSQLAFLNDWDANWQTLHVRPKPPYLTSAVNLMRRVAVNVSPLRPSADDGGLGQVAAPIIGAAEYEVVVGGETPLKGSLEVVVGDTSLASDRWQLQDLAPNQRTLRLRLPVAVQALTFRGDVDARQSISGFSLRVSALAPRPVPPRPARRAARYGDVRAFFLDDNAYPEASGFWTVGQSTAALIIDRDTAAPPSGATIALQSGPVPTSAELVVGAWTTRRTLAAHQRVDVALPAAASGGQPLSIRTGPMFLPALHDPGNRDFRHLGVWVEIH